MNGARYWEYPTTMENEMPRTTEVYYPPVAIACPYCETMNSERCADDSINCRFCDKLYNCNIPEHRSGVSDGSTADYYELPEGATELQDLISHKDMNAQVGECFRSCYRYGESSHSDQLRDAKKIRFYINAEIARLYKLL